MAAGSRVLPLLLALIVAAACGCGDSEPVPEPPVSTVPWPYEPYAPAPIAEPLADEPFVQETNHTTNELEAGIGPLVDVLVAPPEATGFEQPIQITARGVVAHEAGGALEMIAIGAGQADLIGAAFAASELVLAGPDAIHVVDPTARSVTSHAAPAGIAVTGISSGADQAYVLSDQGLGLVRGPAPMTLSWPSVGGPDDAVLAALEAGGRLLLARPSGVSSHPIPAALPLETAAWTFGPADGLENGTVAALVADVTVPEPLDLVVVGASGLAALDLSGSAAELASVEAFTADRVPLEQPTDAVATADGGFVVATSGGAYRAIERDVGPEWRVYNAERWLPDEQVRGVATDSSSPDSPIYFATAGGLATVTAERVTVEQKLAAFVERVVERHDRDGAVADSHLTTPGDLSTNIPWDSDNDGGWTCYWILAECFRYLVTGDPAAKEHFDKSLHRMLSFRTLTGTEHFLARAVIRIEGCQLDDCDDPDDGEWFLSPDGEWWVKGDTSNDEVTSHMFMMGHAHDLCADPEQQAGIRAHVAGIIGGIVDHGYQLIDLDGLVTKHGQFDPFYVNESIAGQLGDGGRRSVQILAALSLAHYLTGEQRFVDAKRELIEVHHYDENVVRESEYSLRMGSGDGDELATQAFFVLLRYESDPALREKWLEGWRRSYGNMRLQQGALWDVVNAMVGGDDPDMFNALRWLRLAPVDMIRWSMHNSHRRDLVAPPDYYDQEGRMRSDGWIIPYDERPNDRWNKDQFKVDGGHGPGIEMDGADVLAPYWMGRYYGYFVPFAQR